MLSPENYIRKKARTLPIGDCLINSNWEKSHIANIYVLRNHANGNVTAGIYLVDLMCMGVKDTFYMFNVPKYSFHEEIGRASREAENVPVSYELAHNIIYSGLAFAEDYGFMPHKYFTSITRFILEEDTEAIEEIDVECGMDGKPAYMSGPYDDAARSARIIAQLERTAGPGNYIVMDSIMNEFDDDEFEEDEDFDEGDEFEKEDFDDEEEYD